MDKLVDAVFQLVQNQHAGKVSALASRVRVTSIESVSGLNNYFGTEAVNRELENMIDHWQRVW